MKQDHCPFCGSRNVYYSSSDEKILCVECSARGPIIPLSIYFDKPTLATILWNGLATKSECLCPNCNIGYW